jgi:hypothetical protein
MVTSSRNPTRLLEGDEFEGLSAAEQFYALAS